jgi:hypothetical protein
MRTSRRIAFEMLAGPEDIPKIRPASVTILRAPFLHQHGQFFAQLRQAF